MLFFENWDQNIIALGIVALTLVVGFACASLFIKFLSKWADKTDFVFDNILTGHLKGPVRLLIPILLLYPASEFLTASWLNHSVFMNGLRVVTIMIMAWLSMRLVRVIADQISSKFDISVKDNLQARRVQTQITVARRIANFIVFLIAVSSIFMMFEQLRGLGVSLLASAGVAGIIIGFSAQKMLGNLLAGIQIAITQPIRLDDVVIVEKEWGWIEEITLTYVVVRIWDLRRMVLPISYFIEQPFQNWTRTSADLLGTVYLYTDYTLPLSPLRNKLTEILESERNNLWDGKVNTIQVTDCKPDVMEIRALVSAEDSSQAWTLRCKVREELLGFIQKNYPKALPKTRAVLGKEAA